MEACYQYLKCKETECIMQNGLNVAACWEVERTLCNHAALDIIRMGNPNIKKADACALSGCIYFQAAKENRI